MVDLQYFRLVFAALTATALSSIHGSFLAPAVEERLRAWLSVMSQWSQRDQEAGKHDAVQCDSRHDQHRTLPCVHCHITCTHTETVSGGGIS